MSACCVAEEMRRRLAAATLTYRTEEADAFTAGCTDAAGAQDGAFACCDFATAVGTLTSQPGEIGKDLRQVPANRS